MTALISLAAMSSDAKIAIGVGVVIFVLLFFKLVMGFIRFFFRHPFWFLLLLLCGGLGFAFSFLLGGVIVVAALAGGGLFWVLGAFDD